MKNRILVVSKGFLHPSILCRHSLKKLLLGLERDFAFEFTRNLRDMGALEGEFFQGVILYFHEKRIDEALFDKFGDFLLEGGGVLAIHSAMASFKKNKKYQDILGGRFLGHGRIRDLEVISNAGELNIPLDPVSFCVRDELYIHEYHKDNSILMVCQYEGGKEPVLWTKTYGRGRVAYFS